MGRLVIGYYDDSESPGGTTRYLEELIGALDRGKFCPLLFAKRPAEWHSRLCDLGVQIITLHKSGASSMPSLPAAEQRPQSGSSRKRRVPLPAGLSWSLGLARETEALVRLFRKRAVNLLHTNNTGAEPAPMAARLAGIPQVLGTWHVDSTYDLEGLRQGPHYRLLEDASMRSLHHAIAVSEATKEDWIRRCRLNAKYQEHITVIHNGIDTGRVQRQHSREDARRLLGIPQNAVIIGSLGRLDTAKGYEFLIRALPQILAKKPSVHLALAGRGPLEQELRSLAQKLGVDSVVQFLGFVSNVRTVLECLDIYVQPSLCEAHPISLLEAGAIGLPVIATSVGGIPETVVHGKTGFVVPPRDPDALASAILTLADQVSFRDTMGARAQERILDLYTRDRMVAKTMAVYEHLLCMAPAAS